MARDEYFGVRDDITSPFTNAVAVTPSDSVDLVKVSRALWIGGAGNISVDMVGGGTVIFTNIGAGVLLPARVTRVRSTSTTATSIVAVW